jgi:NADH-quinone oxidoreductase subunit K
MHLLSSFTALPLAAGTVGLNHYLVLSAVLFAIGFFGVLLRRNTLVVFMCLELMLNAATLAAVAFSRFNGTMDGNVFVFFIITVAAAEVAVGLAIIVSVYRLRGTVQLEQLAVLKH